VPEVKLGPDGGYTQAFCSYCGWASNSRGGMEKALAANAAHERRHPEFKEPESLENWLDAMHADHDCAPGPCVCICGCRCDAGCSALFGPLCATCLIASNRGDSAHDEPPQSADAVDPSAANTGNPTTREKV
jgi:hypothetical protein